MNVLCIIDQDHQRSVIIVDHSWKLRDIYPMANPQRIGYNIENREALITNSRKRINV